VAAMLAGAAQAREASIGIARAAAHGIRAEGVALHLSDGPRAVASLGIERLDAPSLGIAGRVDFSCEVEAVKDAGWACSGPARLISGEGTAEASLGLRFDAARATIELARDGGTVRIAVPFDASAPFELEASAVPSGWLAVPLRRSGHDLALRGGTLDLAGRVSRDGAIEARFAVDGLSVAGADGAAATEGLRAQGRIDVSTGPERRVRGEAQLESGRLHAGLLEVEVASDPIDTAFDATLREDGRVDVARWSWHDADAIEFEASGEFEPSAAAPLRRLEVADARLHFPLLRERYAGALFRRHGLASLALSGRVDARVSVDEDGLQRLALAADALDVHDAARGLRIDALAGGIDWRRQGRGEPVSLGWRRLNLDTLELGPARARWQSRDGCFELIDPLRITTGRGRLELRDTRFDPFSDGERVRSGFALADFAYDSADGTIAIAGLVAGGTFRLDEAGDAPRLRARARLDGGEVLHGTTYVRLPPARIDARIDATFMRDRWHIAQFHWNDPDALEVSAQAELLRGERIAVESVQLDVARLDLAAALPRYAASTLAAAGWPELAGSGRLGGAIRVDASGLRAFSLAADGVSVVDGAGRIALDGLDGSIEWDAAAARAPTSIGWDRLELLHVPFGAARLQLAASAGGLRLAQPLAIDVFGGQLRLERFIAQPRSARGERYAGSFALVGLQMEQVSRAFGWPRFPGNLSGGVPQVEFVDDRIDFRGGLDLYVFDGHLGVSGLSLERPFGVAPALRADVHFQRMDLEQLTRAFSFGGMTGRLSGSISGLRLLDWSPVAFDAWLRTDGGGRMSYKAVDDLTRLGGGGLGAGLQAAALKVFDTFGYRRLGLRCRLADEVCLMAGIEPAPPDTGDSPASGYTIVEGSGMPRLMIVGHHRRVDWPTLVRRLVEATRGQGPVVE